MQSQEDVEAQERRDKAYSARLSRARNANSSRRNLASQKTLLGGDSAADAWDSGVSPGGSVGSANENAVDAIANMHLMPTPPCKEQSHDMEKT